MSPPRSSGIRGLMESVGLVDSRPISETPTRNVVRWFLLAGCLVAVLVILTARSPQHFAMPVLFPLGFGIGLSLAMGEMGRVLLINNRRLTTLGVGLAVSIGLLVISFNWAAQYHARTAAWLKEHPLKKDPLAAEMTAAMNNPPADESATDRNQRLEFKASIEATSARLAEEEARRRESATFSGYLRDRWANFGPMKDLKAPWPLLLWLTELTTATALACLLQWTSRPPASPDESARP